jgi:WD40 repeat protein
VNFSPDGRRIVSSSRDGTIRIWDLQSEKVRKIIFPLPNDQWLAIKPGSLRYFSSSDGDLYAGVRFANNSYNWKPLAEFREEFRVDKTIPPIVRILSPQSDTHVDHHTIGIKLHIDAQSVPLEPTRVFVNNQAIDQQTILMLDAFKKDHVCDYFIPLGDPKNTIRFDVTNVDGMNGFDEIVVYRDDL